jgi:molecular chaperone GrpE
MFSHNSSTENSPQNNQAENFQEPNLENKNSQGQNSESQDSEKLQNKQESSFLNNNLTSEEATKLQEENANLSRQIEEISQKNADLTNKLLRSFAEIENLKKRHIEEMQKTSKFAISSLVKDLIPTIENFFLAIENGPNFEECNDQIKNFATGIDLTKKELVKTLEKNQVTRIYPLKEKFDHNLHEAVSQMPSQEEDIIMAVIQAGYKIEDRLVKPAMVVVGKKL